MMFVSFYDFLPYYDKYMEAREKAGIKESKMDAEDNFIKYMVEDVDLGF